MYICLNKVTLFVFSDCAIHKEVPQIFPATPSSQFQLIVSEVRLLNLHKVRQFKFIGKRNNI